MTQEVINVRNTPSISDALKNRTGIVSSSNAFHQDFSIIKMELVSLKSFVVDQIHMVSKKNHETLEAKDLEKFLTDTVKK